MKTARCTTHSVTLDLHDALELSQVLDYLHEWLSGAGDGVHADLRRFAGEDNATPVVRRSLTAFSQLLILGEADDVGDSHPDPDPEQGEPW